MKRKSVLRQSIVLSLLTLFLLLPPATVFAMGSKPPAPLPVGLSTGKHFHCGAYERYFDVYIPAGLNGPAPLVLEMHGLGSNKEDIRGYSGLYQKADQEKFIIAWPQGLINSWNGIICCPPANGLMVNDVDFLRELVSWIAARANVDLDRVYATGHSNGGAMSHQLGLWASDVFTAIAAVSFHLTDSSTWVAPSRSVPVLEIHGKKDELVWYPASPEFGSVEDGFHDWASLDECVGRAQITWQNDNGAFRKTYADCAGNVPHGFRDCVLFIVRRNDHGDGIVGILWRDGVEMI